MFKKLFFNANSRELIGLYLPLRNVFSSVTQLEAIDPQQEKLLTEKCILVNNKDEVIGSGTKKECHLLCQDGSPPPLHRAFSVFLFNTKEELLLQQRSSYKITFPKFFTNSCCSHPQSTEEELVESGAQGIKLAAQRRMCFELGILKHELQPSDFTYITRIHYASPSMDSKWGEHEIDYILIVKKDVTLSINENEVAQTVYVKEIEFPQFIKSLEKQNIHITPWFRLISERFLPLWWKNLDKIDQYIDHKTVHYMK